VIAPLTVKSPPVPEFVPNDVGGNLIYTAGVGTVAAVIAEGKSVLKKLAWLTGAAVIGLFMWLAGHNSLPK